MPSIKIKIQVSNNHLIAFGPGKAELLEAISQHGSISGAAKSMKMSYKRAWELVMVMNNSFKEPLVTTIVGGPHGGGATITAFGLEVLGKYQEVLTKSEKFVLSEMDSFLGMLATETPN
ncbi:MAG TPA: ModE family transcriptional regulator [Methylotenera sp.]|nr:ModE family transcriptional regulator [Methylotenera sp.]